MRPLVICFSYTLTALIIAGCSSTGSIPRPFKGAASFASSAKDSSEYDRDPPAQRISPRVASEPSPAPPARGISLTRTIEAAQTAFRRKSGCGDSCAEEGCTQQGCETRSPGLHCFGIHFNRMFDGHRLARFKCNLLPRHKAADSCTDRGCGSYPFPSPAPQTQAPRSECHPRMAPPLGEQPTPYDDQNGQSFQPEPIPQPEDSMMPGAVPDIPVEPISRQSHVVAPAEWHQQPLYSSAEATQRPEFRNRWIQRDPPSWSPNGNQGRTSFRPSDTLVPSASRLKSPALDGEFRMVIQPTIRISDSATPAAK